MLFEELLLVGYNDKGKPATSPDRYFNRALATAVLAELMLADRIWVQRHQPHLFTPSKDIIRVSDPTPLGDPEADHALHRLTHHDLSPAAHPWIFVIAQTERMRDRESMLHRRLLDRYMHYGIIRRHHHKALGMFPVVRYLQNDTRPQEAVSQRLHNLIHGAPVDPRTATLLLIIDAGHIGTKVFLRQQDERENFAKQLRTTEWDTTMRCDSIKALIVALRAFSTRGGHGWASTEPY